jgi:hypothetical protein
VSRWHLQSHWIQLCLWRFILLQFLVLMTSVWVFVFYFCISRNTNHRWLPKSQSSGLSKARTLDHVLPLPTSSPHDCSAILTLHHEASRGNRCTDAPLWTNAHLHQLSGGPLYSVWAFKISALFLDKERMCWWMVFLIITLLTVNEYIPIPIFVSIFFDYLHLENRY